MLSWQLQFCACSNHLFLDEKIWPLGLDMYLLKYISSTNPCKNTTICLYIFILITYILDLCYHLVVRAPGYRSRWPGFGSRSYQIFWQVVGLEQGPLSLISTIEELLERQSSCAGLENRDYGRGDLPRWPLDTLFPQKLALTSPISGSSSVDIVRSRTKATELLLSTFIEGTKGSIQGKRFCFLPKNGVWIQWKLYRFQHQKCHPGAT
jgi:hypothetical protein